MRWFLPRAPAVLAMVQIDILYRGGLRCEATHEPSGRALETDAPRDNEGRGESFSPTDLLATALGTCMLTIMGIVANKHAWELGQTEVRVQKHMLSDPVRRIGQLIVTVRVPSRLPLEAQQVLVEAALGCPVAMSISDQIEVQLELLWGAPEI